MKNNYLIPKIFGSIAISAVMIIGVYVLIIDLPRKTNQSNTVVSEQAQSKVAEKTTTLPSSQTTTPAESNASQTTTTNSTTNTSNNTSGSTTTPPATSTPSTPTTPTPTPTYKYNSGSYAKSKTYDIPDEGLTWTLNATIEIKDDVVAFVTTNQATSGKSLKYYNDFAAAVGPAVNGKKIDTLSISKLGDASYTSDAFNAILSLVRSAAKK